MGAHLNETPPGGWRVSINGHSARSLSMTAVVDEIRMKLVGGGIPVPENLIAISINLQSICHPRR